MIDQLKKENSEFSTQIQEDGDKISNLQQEVGKGLKVIVKKDEEINYLQTKVSDLQSNIDQLEGQCSEYGADYKKKIEECEKLESSLQDLQLDYKNVCSQAESDKKALDCCTTELETIKSYHQEKQDFD